VLCSAPPDTAHSFCVQVSESLADKVHDAYHLPDVQGSDHCPIGIVLRTDSRSPS
jgi:hypothetical protein